MCIRDRYQAEGLNEEEAKAKAEANSPLMLEAREMLRKWEANDPEMCIRDSLGHWSCLSHYSD